MKIRSLLHFFKIDNSLYLEVNDVFTKDLSINSIKIRITAKVLYKDTYHLIIKIIDVEYIKRPKINSFNILCKTGFTIGNTCSLNKEWFYGIKSKREISQRILQDKINLLIKKI